MLTRIIQVCAYKWAAQLEPAALFFVSEKNCEPRQQTCRAPEVMQRVLTKNIEKENHVQGVPRLMVRRGRMMSLGPFFSRLSSVLIDFLESFREIALECELVEIRIPGHKVFTYSIVNFGTNVEIFRINLFLQIFSFLKYLVFVFWFFY